MTFTIISKIKMPLNIKSNVSKILIKSRSYYDEFSVISSSKYVSITNLNEEITITAKIIFSNILFLKIT